jgi:hypothetical protein
MLLFFRSDIVSSNDWFHSDCGGGRKSIGFHPVRELIA